MQFASGQGMPAVHLSVIGNRGNSPSKVIKIYAFNLDTRNTGRTWPASGRTCVSAVSLLHNVLTRIAPQRSIMSGPAHKFSLILRRDLVLFCFPVLVFNHLLLRSRLSMPFSPASPHPKSLTPALCEQRSEHFQPSRFFSTQSISTRLQVHNSRT